MHVKVRETHAGRVLVMLVIEPREAIENKANSDGTTTLVLNIDRHDAVMVAVQACIASTPLGRADVVQALAED